MTDAELDEFQIMREAARNARALADTWAERLDEATRMAADTEAEAARLETVMADRRAALGVIAAPATVQ